MAGLEQLLRVIDSWRRFWFAEVEPHGMAVYRMLMGTYLLAYFGRYVSHVDLLFSSDGVYVPVLVPDIAPPPLVAWAIYAFLLAAIVLFTLGYRTVVLTPVVLGLYAYHWLLNLAVKDTSYDRLILILLAISCFGTLDGAWALSARSKRDGEALDSPPRISAWAGRLLAVQIAALYFGSGVSKLAHTSWRSGKMLEMSLAGPWGTEAAFWLVGLGIPDWLWTTLTWSVVVLELALGFLLYLPRTQKLAILLGLSFHVGVWVFLWIPEFMVCVTVYVLFLDPGDVRRTGERMVARWRQ